jgi:hypothetical protein
MTIVKTSGGYKVVSHTGKNLGESKSKEGAVKRLRQVEYFKRLKKCFNAYQEPLEKEGGPDQEEVSTPAEQL